MSQWMPYADRAATVVVVLAAAFFLGFGLWALLDPRSFYDELATFPPYNRHLIHDIGAFQIGIGAVLLLALVVRDAAVVALGGAGIGSAVHGAAHAADIELGGSDGDTALFLIIAAVLLVAAAAKYAAGRARAEG